MAKVTTQDRAPSIADSDNDDDDVDDDDDISVHENEKLLIETKNYHSGHSYSKSG